MSLRTIISAAFMLIILAFTGNHTLLAKPTVQQHKIKRVVTLTPVDAALKSTASGIAKIAYQQDQPRHQFQVIAAGLQPETDYILQLNNLKIALARSDKNGALEFSYRWTAKMQASLNDPYNLPLSHDINRQLLKLIPSLKVIHILDSQGKLVLRGRIDRTIHQEIAPNDPIDTIEPAGAVDNVVVEVNKIVTVQILVSDPNGDPLVYTVSCDRGNFITVTGITITVAPKDGDLGSYSCKLTATDKFNLSIDTFFNVTVIAANKPPTIAPVTDKTVRVNDVDRSTIIQASDPNGDVLKATVISSVPAIRSLTPSGGNSFTLELAPRTEADGGRVTIQVTDPGGLTAQVSFNIVVQKIINITSVMRVKPNLFISGAGFTSAGAKVTVNGVDVSARIIGQSNTSITLKGTNKKLNLKSGANQVIVTVGGITSNAFVVNL